MPKGILFWVLMLLLVVLGGVVMPREGRWYGFAGVGLILFLLLLLLGWAVFGPPLQ